MLLNTGSVAHKVKRKSRGERPHLHNMLECPARKFKRLIDTGRDTRSKTYQEYEEGYITAHYFQKCPHCKASIGIRKIE
jgi:hypothetical protein